MLLHPGSVDDLCAVYPGLQGIQGIVQPIAVQAQESIASNLPAAGRRYCWSELLPSAITAVLELAIARAELNSGSRGRLEDAARRAARDWVPLHECERVCEIVLGCVCRVLWETSEPGNCTVMLGLSRWAADKLPAALAVLRAAYIDEMRRLGGRRRDDDIVIGTLLDGGDARAVACAVGRPLPEPCAVLALGCADRRGPGQGFSFTTPPGGVLDALSDAPGMLCAANWERSVLVAVIGIPPASAGTSVRAVRQLAERAVDACESVYGHAFVAGLAMSDTAATVGQAAWEAVDTSAVLADSDRRCRVAFSEEIALDILIGSHDGLRQRLTKRVADVASRPDLWETLRELYQADLDRGRTARRLGVHRSTLDYRLNRVEQLAGISPTSVQGILLFASARAATPASEPAAVTARSRCTARMRCPL
jgi:PucR C-terminal helix-turn-helix domain